MPRSTATRSHGRRKKRSHLTASTPTPKQPVQPVKTQKRWPWLMIVAVTVILVSFGIWRATTGSPSTTSAVTITSLPTPTPTPKRNWHTLLTFSGGNETKNTQKFKVPADWQFTWSCQGVNGVDGGLNIVIYNTNGSLYNAGAQITCLAAKKVSGSVEEFKSGNVYLSINGNGPWTVSVQKP